MTRARRFLGWVNAHAGAIMVGLAILMAGTYVLQVGSALQTQRCQAELLSGVSKLVSAPPTQDPEIRAARSRAFVSLFARYNEC